jgi:hypothetical protein
MPTTLSSCAINQQVLQVNFDISMPKSLDEQYRSLEIPASSLDDLGEIISLGHLDLAHVDQDKVGPLRQGETQSELLKVGTEDVSSLLVSLNLVREESLLIGEFETLGDGFLQGRVGTEDDPRRGLQGSEGKLGGSDKPACGDITRISLSSLMQMIHLDENSPIRQPVAANDFPALPTVKVLSHIPGKAAILTCSVPSKVKQSYCLISLEKISLHTLAFEFVSCDLRLRQPIRAHRAWCRSRRSRSTLLAKRPFQTGYEGC